MSRRTETAEQIQARTAKAAMTRAAMIAATRPTTRPGSEKTTLRPGDSVVIQRDDAATAIWQRYAGRTGTVAVVNTQRFENGTTYVEIGVQFGPVNRDRDDWKKRLRVDSWFRADEVRPA